MPTVIDSLVVELGLDPSQGAKGAKEFQRQIKNTRDAAGTGAKDMEAYGKRASSFFSSLRNEAVGLFLAFQGASSITSFVTGMLEGDAATGRLAQNLGMAGDRLSAWQLAVKSVGGDAKDANTALGLMAQAFRSLTLTGDTGHNANFQGLGITKAIMAQGPEAMLMQMAKMAETMDKPEFYARMQRIGIPESVINTLEMGRKGVNNLVTSRLADGAASIKEEKAAADFQAQLAKLEAHITGVVRPAIYGLVTDALDFVDAMQKGKVGATDLNNVLIPLAVLAGLAGAPFVALAAAVALVATNIDFLKKKWTDFSDWWNNLNDSADAIMDPIRRALGLKTGAEARRDHTDVMGNPTGGGGAGGAPTDAGGPSGPPSRGGAGVNYAYIHRELTRSGMTDDQAQGVVAGMMAEGGSLGMAKNGAFGIGQWRGTRQRALFAKYGPNPNQGQQVAFLISELHGGDPGGRNVLNQVGAAGTGLAYLRSFMRPQGAHGEHMRDLIADNNRMYNNLGMAKRASLAAAGAHRDALHKSTSTTHIGTINVHTKATDADAIARDMRMAVRRRLIAQNANHGMQ